MKPKTLKETYEEFKASALSTKLIEEVILCRTQEQVERLVEDSEYRTLYVVISDADIYTEVDVIAFSITIVDKTNDDDESYLDSINDAMTCLKSISDILNYSTDSEIKMDDIMVGSGAIEGKLVTAVSCQIMFVVEYLPNIYKSA